MCFQLYTSLITDICLIALLSEVLATSHIKDFHKKYTLYVLYIPFLCQYIIIHLMQMYTKFRKKECFITLIYDFRDITSC